MDLPAGTSIIGFADGALVVCAAEDVNILELRINDSLWRAKRWLDSRCLQEASEKTEALLFTDRRSFKYPRIVLGEHEIEGKKSIKYLGVQLDRRLSFNKHRQITKAKAVQCWAALTRLMPNIVRPREAKRRLVASVVNSMLLYAAPIWTSALNNHAILKELFSAQRGWWWELSQHTELWRAGNQSLTHSRMEGADSSRNGRRDDMVTNPGDGQTVWSRSWPPGCIESTAQSAFTWRKRFRAMVASMRTRSASRKRKREAVGRAVGAQLTFDTMVSLMLQSEQISNFKSKFEISDKNFKLN